MIAIHPTPTLETIDELICERLGLTVLNPELTLEEMGATPVRFAALLAALRERCEVAAIGACHAGMLPGELLAALRQGQAA